jgi:preprotein translocase subunit Sss1
MTLPVRSAREARNRVLRAETIGILIFAIIGFVIVLLRYGRHLDWHAR